MSSQPDQPLRQGILKATRARAAGGVLIEPRQLHSPAPDAAPEPDSEADGLSELHAGLRLDPELVSAERAADRILSEARVQRETLLDSAQREAQEARDRMGRELAAMQEAAELELAEQRTQLLDGLRRELDEQYRERYGNALSQLEQAASALARQREEYLGELEQPAFSLILAIARQLLGCELSHQPQFLAELIARAFAQLQPAPAAQLALHPETLELLQQDELLAGVFQQHGLQLEQVKLQANPALRPDQFELQAGQALIAFDLQAKAGELVAELEERARSGSAAAGGAT